MISWSIFLVANFFHTFLYGVGKNIALEFDDMAVSRYREQKEKSPGIKIKLKTKDHMPFVLKTISVVKWHLCNYSTSYKSSIDTVTVYKYHEIYIFNIITYFVRWPARFVKHRFSNALYRYRVPVDMYRVWPFSMTNNVTWCALYWSTGSLILILCRYHPPGKCPSLIIWPNTHSTRERMSNTTPIARFIGPPWGQPGTDRIEVGPMLAAWTLLSGYNCRFMSITLWISHLLDIGEYSVEKFWQSV